MTVISEQQPVSDNQPSTDDFGVRDVITSIWAIRGIVFTTMLVSALAIAGLFAFFRASLPSEQTYQHAVAFSFSSVEKNTYPNGKPFSLNELASPTVLQAVYDKNKLSEAGLSYKNFSSGVSITPYAPTYKDVAKRYRARLSTKKMPFSQQKNIEQEMAKALNSISKKNALVSLRLTSPFGISDVLGKKLVSDIATSWSQISIEQRGVLSLSGDNSTNELIDIASFTNLDYPNAIQILDLSVERLVTLLDTLTQIDGAKSVADLKSGHSAASLQREIKNLINFSISPLTARIKRMQLMKDPQTTRLTYQHQILELTLERQRLLRKVKSLEQVLALFRENQQGAVETGQKVPETQGAPVITSMPQLSEGFIEKIIELTAEGRDLKYRQDIISKWLATQEEVAKLDTRIALRNSFFEAIKKQDNDTELYTGEQLKSARLDVEAGLGKTAEELNNYWKLTQRIFSLVSSQHNSNTSQLYHPLPLSKSMSVQTYHPIANENTMLIALGLFTALTLLSILFGLIGQVIRRK